jgi:3-deoxy-D-manno-octulosonate 8-phosphate phosphatase (KDO 8-P phosphatase)
MSKIIVVSDCDGCLTDGNFIYTEDGKVAKIYGAHDNDGVKLLKKNGIEIQFISADKRGFPITKKRIEDMKCPIMQCTEEERNNYFDELLKSKLYDTIVFFGDGIHDAYVKRDHPEIYFISPANARPEAIYMSDYVTPSRGGQGAFLDLAIQVVNIFCKNK